MEILQKDIDDKFANAVDWFGTFLPNLISFYALFTKRPNNKIQSIRICVKTDITPVFEYNEQWVRDVEPHMFNKILSLELYRFILHHPTHRELHGPNAFISSTAVCNIKELDKFIYGAPQQIIDHVKELLIDREKVEEILGEKISDEDFYYEGVYELLNRKEEQEQQNGDGEDGENQPSDGEDGQSQNGQGAGSEDGDESDEENQSQSSSGQGDSDEDEDGESDVDGDSDQSQNGQNSGSGDEREPGQNDNTDEDENSSSSGQNDKEEQDENGSDGDSDGDGESQKSKKSSQRKSLEDWVNSGEENTEEWGSNSVVDEMIIDTLEHKCKPENWGDLSGEQVEEIILKNKRKVNIGPIISSFAASIRCRKRHSTRMRYNKRYGLAYPGYRYDRKNKVLFAIDSSGSMSDSDISKGCEILHNFLKKTEIDIAFWDSKMLDPTPYKREVKKLEAPGRGGTKPSCIGDWLDEHHEHYDGVIIFTDCYWSWTKKNIDTEIFIISSEQEYKERIPSFVKKHASIQELTHIFD